MGLPLRLGLETLGVGGAPPGLGGKFPPLAAAPFRWDPRGRAPQGAYIKGEGGLLYPSPWRLPLPPVTPLPPACAWRSPAKIPATSTTTPSCCWISINLSFPLAGSRRRRRRCSVHVLNAEVPSIRHSVIGDLDHDEYDSINPVHMNASARDLQGYVDALLPSRC